MVLWATKPPNPPMFEPAPPLTAPVAKEPLTVSSLGRRRPGRRRWRSRRQWPSLWRTSAADRSGFGNRCADQPADAMRSRRRRGGAGGRQDPVDGAAGGRPSPPSRPRLRDLLRPMTVAEEWALTISPLATGRPGPRHRVGELVVGVPARAGGVGVVVADGDLTRRRDVHHRAAFEVADQRTRRDAIAASDRGVGTG